jgi:hypothetical protein
MASTPAPRQPKAPNKYGAFSTMRSIPDRYLFGTEAEIADRIATGYVTNPSEAAPSFTQIRPGPTGKDANDPNNSGMKSYTGAKNYDGNPRRYA